MFVVGGFDGSNQAVRHGWARTVKEKKKEKEKEEKEEDKDKKEEKGREDKKEGEEKKEKEKGSGWEMFNFFGGRASAGAACGIEVRARRK